MHLSHLVSPQWQLQVGAGVLDVLLSACVGDDGRSIAVGRGEDRDRVVQDVHSLAKDAHNNAFGRGGDRYKVVQDVHRSVTAGNGLMHAVTKSVLRGKLLYLGKKILATRVAFEKIRGQMKTILS